MKHTLLTILTFLSLSAHAQIITTIAGGGTALGDGGQATTAKLQSPSSVTVDVNGNIYIADRNANRIRKINTGGVIVTIAGTGIAGYNGDNGPATDAELNQPYGIAVDGLGNVYFTDNFNFRIRKVNTSGIISTIGGIGTPGYSGDNGPATTAKIDYAGGIAIDALGDLFIAEGGNSCIRKINSSGIMTTVAGTGVCGFGGDNGPATTAQLCTANDVALDGNGNIYIADYGNNRIRKVNTNGIIITVAGTGINGFGGDNGPATSAKIIPTGVCIKNNYIFIADGFNNRVRGVDAFGIITTIAGGGASGLGDGGLAIDCELSNPVGLHLDTNDDLFIADLGNNRIRHISSVLSVNNVNNAISTFDIYPNPNYGTFCLKATSAISADLSIIITNITGEKIKEIKTYTNVNVLIDLHCAPGMYLLSIVTSNGISTKRIMVSQ